MLLRHQTVIQSWVAPHPSFLFSLHPLTMLLHIRVRGFPVSSSATGCGSSKTTWREILSASIVILLFLIISAIIIILFLRFLIIIIFLVIVFFLRQWCCNAGCNIIITFFIFLYYSSYSSSSPSSSSSYSSSSPSPSSSPSSSSSSDNLTLPSWVKFAIPSFFLSLLSFLLLSITAFCSCVPAFPLFSLICSVVQISCLREKDVNKKQDEKAHAILFFFLLCVHLFEVLAHAFGFLSLQELARLSSVNRVWNKSVNRARSDKIQLALSGKLFANGFDTAIWSKIAVLVFKNLSFQNSVVTIKRWWRG